MTKAQQDYELAIKLIKEKHPEFFTWEKANLDQSLHYDFSRFAHFIVEECIKKNKLDKVIESAKTLEALKNIKGDTKGNIRNAAVVSLLECIGGIGQNAGPHIKLFCSKLSHESKSYLAQFYNKKALVKLGILPHPVEYGAPLLVFIICLSSLILHYTIGSSNIDHWLYGGDAEILFWMMLPISLIWFGLVVRRFKILRKKLNVKRVS